MPETVPDRGFTIGGKQVSDFYHGDRTRYTEGHGEAQPHPPFG